MHVRKKAGKNTGDLFAAAADYGCVNLLCLRRSDALCTRRRAFYAAASLIAAEIGAVPNSYTLFRPSITFAGVIKRGVFIAGVTVMTAGRAVLMFRCRL